MQVINTFWEKRNLGIETKEIVLSNSDYLSNIESIIDSLSSTKQYVVVKIPVGKPEYIKLLTEKGYCFIESMFEASLLVKDFQLPKSLVKFDEMLSYKKLTVKEDFERLEMEIKKGIFTSDRIALDPDFGIDISAIRYINWLKDEQQRGGEIFEITYKERPIGFFNLKNISGGKYNSFLAGIYRNESNMGFGFSILSKLMTELKNRQAKSCTVHISSNNLPIMRLYCHFGFYLKDIVYVMTKTY